MSGARRKPQITSLKRRLCAADRTQLHASSVGGKGYRRFCLVEDNVMRGEEGRSHASTITTALECSGANCSAVSAKQSWLMPPEQNTYDHGDCVRICHH